MKYISNASCILQELLTYTIHILNEIQKQTFKDLLFINNEVKLLFWYLLGGNFRPLGGVM